MLTATELHIQAVKGLKKTKRMKEYAQTHNLAKKSRFVSSGLLHREYYSRSDVCFCMVSRISLLYGV